MSTSTAEAAVLSTIRHVTAKKWDKAAAQLDSLEKHLRDAEASLKYKPGVSGSSDLEADVLMLLATVRGAFVGSLCARVDARSVSTDNGLEGRVRSKLPGTTECLVDRLNVIERMLWEAKYSAGFSTSAMVAWREELLDILRQGRNRMVYTSLFGRLTNEWAEHRFGELSTAKRRDSQGTEASSPSGNLPGVAVGRKEMHQQRQVWESHVTREHKTNIDRINAFMDDLFQAGAQQKESSAGEPVDMRTSLLQGVRAEIQSNCGGMLSVTKDSVKDAVKAVLSADQLTSEKRRAMLDISNRDNVLSEIANLLSIDLNLDSLNRWSWGAKPISAQMRKAINGKYRVYLDLELLDAILIQCIGKLISVGIKEALSTAWSSVIRDVWRPKQNESREAALEKHISDLGRRRSQTSVQNLRQTIYEKSFFAVSLPDETDNELDWYEASQDSGSGEHKLKDLIRGETSRVSLRTDILRLCTTDMAIQKLVRGQFCILQSDFEWFGPSLPHSTLFAIMEYFHFPKQLVHFVQSFLNMHMRFDEDGPNGDLVARKAGIPVSFQITDGISELLLFVLDFAVNQRTNGSFLYRNHDDLWFWGQPKECAAAWEVICEFTDVMGMRLNKDKTGFAHAADDSNPRFVAAKEEVFGRLPGGEIKWGFLLFDPNEWRWTANQPAIEEHLSELRFQLKSRTAVMAHVQAYNAYMKNFLPNNFGPVVRALGESHPLMVLEALKHALQCLYGGEGSEHSLATEKKAGNAADHVRRLIQDNFGENYAVPDCFLYLEVENGGLGLANPVPDFAKYVEIGSDTSSGKELNSKISKAVVSDSTMETVSSRYREDKKRFTERQRFAERERGKRKGQKSEISADTSESEADEYKDALAKRLQSDSRFMSFSDYLATCEEHSSTLADLYEGLLRAPDAVHERHTSNHWALDMFHDDLETIFGGYVAEDEFLSLGLYRTLAEEKVRWEG